MTDDNDEEALRVEILRAARRALEWRRLRVLRSGSSWLVEQAGGRASGQRWTAEPRATGPGWWFIREVR